MKTKIMSSLAVAIVALLVMSSSESRAERPLLVTYYYFSPTTGQCTSVSLNPLNCSVSGGGGYCTAFIAAEGTVVTLWTILQGNPCGTRLYKNN